MADSKAMELTESQSRLLEQKKITRKKFKDRVLKNSRKLDKLQKDTTTEARGLLKNLDRGVRDRITSFADNEQLSRGNINQSIDSAVDDYLEKRKQLSRRTIQKSFDTSDEFRKDIAGISGDTAKPSQLKQKSLDKLLKKADERNQLAADKLRARLKLEVTQGQADGKTPKQIAQDMVKKRVVTPERKPGDKSRRGAYAVEAENVAEDVRQTFNQSLQDSAENDAVPGTKKAWLNQDDGRVRPDHITAGIEYAIGGKPGPIGLRELFRVGGQEAIAPRDPRLKPNQRKNCRCYVIHIPPKLDEQIDKRGRKPKKK